MRIWSIHPKYLDRQGLLALWRETLLAKKVLEGKTKGYKNHPQLIRFKKSKIPLESINYYLSKIWEEAKERGYEFDKKKFENPKTFSKIKVTKGQISFETKHLLKKLKKRDIEKFEDVKYIKDTESHPLFEIVGGEREEWEKV